MKSRLAKNPYVPVSSQNARRADTLLRQMADLARGDRLRELRNAKHLGQQQVADAVPVTLRAYQDWESGKGIKWENAKRLAEFHGVNPESLVTRERPTPDLTDVLDSQSQLDRMEGKLDQLLEASGATSPETDAGEGIDGSPKTPGEEPSPQADRDEPETERGG